MVRSAIILCALFFCLILIYGFGDCHQQHTQQQPYRTSFHFQPLKNWMNDPNGPMYYKGVYHLFYQYNPYAAVWGNITWAHSVSYNLIDWIHVQHAIVPSEPSYDIRGCWSGSATILPPGNKPPHILYTGMNSAGEQVQNLAVAKNPSDPFLLEWEKSAHNPLMTAPVGIDPNFFRDPTTAWIGSDDDDTWRVVVGSQIDGHGAAVLYKSDDFVTWKRSDKLLHSSNRTGMWECPDFYPVLVRGENGLDTSANGANNVEHVLKASFNDHDYYIIGRYDPRTDGFDVGVDFMDDDDEAPLRYDYGVFYASKTFYDGARKRRILWGWVTEADAESNAVARGWSGLQSIPRSVLLDESGKQLIQWPIEEVEKLRYGEEVTFANEKLKSNGVFEVEGITASQADVEISFQLPKLEDVESIDDENSRDPQVLCSRRNASTNGKFGPFGLLVLASVDLVEHTAVFFQVFKSRGENVVLMCTDQSRSSVKTHVKEPIFGAFLPIDPTQKISLRTLIDHSIVESFGGGGKVCITCRVYPEIAIDGKSHIYAFNNGTQSILISSLNGWSMKNAQIVAEVHRRRRKPSFT